MAEFNDLNTEILSFIITLMATSANGATDLARLSATCHKLLKLSRDREVIMVVSFRKISVDDYGAHRHLKAFFVYVPVLEIKLLSQCWERRMILEHDFPLLAAAAPGNASGLLRCHSLVRNYISYATDATDDNISTMRIPLLCYMIAHLGYDVACISGILIAIANMCSYYLEKRVNLVHEVHMPPFRGITMALAWLTPPSGRAHRAPVLKLYDQLFSGRQ